MLILTAPIVTTVRLGGKAAPEVKDVLSYIDGLSLIWLAAGAFMVVVGLLATGLSKWRPGVIHQQVLDFRLSGPVAESSKNAAEYERWEERAESVARKKSEASRATWSSISRTFNCWGAVTVFIGAAVGILKLIVAG